MTANQRRPGFRLPWSSDADETGQPADAQGGTEAETSEQPAPPAADAPAPEATGSNGSTPQPAPSEPAPEAPQTPAPVTAAAETPPHRSDAAGEPPNGFMRDLVAAMRKVADEARQAGVEQLKTRADEAVRALESDAEKRRADLRQRAEADIAGVGEWARAEAERIKAEAEQRVASRRAQLEQQLAADETRTEAESRALRARVADYERELEAYHAQLAEITDPAAFAAAAKRMPSPPPLVAHAGPPAGAAADDKPDGAAEPQAPESSQATPATPAGAADVHPAEEEVLAARLAELDAKLETAPVAASEAAPASAPAANGEPTTTDVVVKGLGSFGAITGFRQSLASQDGISGVALSLGQTGEFVFRATHANGVDVAAAITAIEGEGATIEPRPEGGLRVTLERAR